MMTRRKLLATAVSAPFVMAPALVGLSACGNGILRRPHDGLPFPVDSVDAHAHIFNAADLPVYGFLTKTQLGEVPIELKPVAHELIAFAARLMTRHSIGPREELAELDRSTYFTAYRTRSELVQSVGETIFASLVYPLRSSVSVSDVEKRREFHCLVLGDACESEKSIFEASVKAAERMVTPDRAKAFSGLSHTRKVLFAYLRWAAGFLRSRRQNVEHYEKIFGGQNSGMAAMIPATIDYDLWLNDVASNQQDQVDVMSALVSRRPAGITLLPVVAYCPWRDLVRGQEGLAFERVKDAVLNKGFVGVKLYPPMGYRASANEFDSGPYPQGAPTGRALDEVLDRLFEWCEREGAVVMAHCANTNAVSYAFGERANPLYWAPVLKHYPDLRLNLSHFGGLFASNGEDWARSIISLMRDYRNLYTDIADFEFVLRRNGEDRDVAERSISFLTRALDDEPTLRRRLLFGTDWIMLGREYQHERYLAAWSKDYGSFNPTEPDLQLDFMRDNALRFLGMGRTQANGQRLADFYRSHQLDPNLLPGGDIDS